ncbi:dihydrolipoamide dehydrogenase [Geomicrobium halophilum]|uniref:Dihydrolipoyl dehydrogenase n=1 Tax=Geomicrobium halophilum TaxID=549000 RepID=A0A841PXZ9_9BACL|nr:dihydrolipoyl dehydrogenase [Geomicrobium halophilum]MBB6448945.1 dihydrolipoamide dehydrogenase [Geomicrobium halophilum]
MPEEYDLVVIGAGTGGYVAAIRAAQLGNQVALIEKGEVGGTCLHKGCIPSKALLRSAEVYSEAKRAEEFGVHTGKPQLDFTKVQSRKQTIVDQLSSGVQQLLKKEGITIYEGHARILGPSIFSPRAGSISIEKNDGSENEVLVPKHVIIASGSKPRQLPGIDFSQENVMTSDDALFMESLPASIVIIGGGVIGIEWASMLVDFDVDVTVLEAQDRLLSGEDEAISNEMRKQLEARGVQIVVNADVRTEDLDVNKEGISLSADVGGKTQNYHADRLLVSVGREANISDIGLQNTEIETERGKIVTNGWGQTKEAHIYAIGDVVRGFELAHVASHEGVTAVEHMNEMQPAKLNAHPMPRCTYSHPEVASVGLSEAEAKAQGFDVKVGIFPLQAIGKALIQGDKEGFCKFVSDGKTNDLLGVHIIGAKATELIAEGTLAMLLDAADWEVAETVHPHPSLSEVFKEAALQADQRAIHI